MDTIGGVAFEQREKRLVLLRNETRLGRAVSDVVITGRRAA